MTDTHDDLQQSQDQLGKTLDKARAGEDRELASQIRDTGERLIRQLYGAMRLTGIHDLENAAYDKPIRELVVTTTDLIDLLGAVHLVAVEGQIYINDVRVRMDERMDIGGKLGHILRTYGLGGVSLHSKVDGDQFRRFIEGFADKPREDGRSRVHMQKRLMELGADTIELQGVYRLRISGEHVAAEDVDQHKVARNASMLVEATVDSLGQSRMPNPLTIRRVVTEMLDVGPGGEGMWEEAASSDKFSAHTVRVGLLCMMIGKGLGLSNELMQDLGVAAMFHDVGYAFREGAQPGGEDQPAVAGFAPPFERHAAAGARMLLRQRGFHEAKIHRALATLQHHDDYEDGTDREPPTLFARILHVAEAYDTLLRGAGQPKKPRPPTVLKKLWAHAGTRYDPVVLQALTNELGKWPPGSVLRLEDGSVVQVQSNCRSPETWARPMCTLIQDGAGSKAQAGARLDLATSPLKVVGAAA